MAASRVAGIVDPTKPGEYPIVLSDALLGGRASSKETFTGITCELEAFFTVSSP